MTPTEQRALALRTANEKRSRVAELRRQLASERGALADILNDPPPELEHLAIIDVVRLAYGKRSSRSLQRLGQLAVRDHINLLMPLGQASTRTRAWVAGHAAWHWSAATPQRRTVLIIDPADTTVP